MNLDDEKEVKLFNDYLAWEGDFGGKVVNQVRLSNKRLMTESARVKPELNRIKSLKLCFIKC